MSLEQLARETAEEIENRIRATNKEVGISDVKFIALDKLLLQMLSKAVKEKDIALKTIRRLSAISKIEIVDSLSLMNEAATEALKE